VLKAKYHDHGSSLGPRLRFAEEAILLVGRSYSFRLLLIGVTRFLVREQLLYLHCEYDIVPQEAKLRQRIKSFYRIASCKSRFNMLPKRQNEGLTSCHFFTAFLVPRSEAHRLQTFAFAA